MKELNFTDIEVEEEVTFSNADDDFLSLIINYPDFFKKTIVKSEYFNDDARILFEILREEYEKIGEFIVDRLFSYKNFNVSYFTKLLSNNIFFSSKEIKFREIEKFLLERYKKNKYSETVKAFDGNCEKLYETLTKLNDIDCEQSDYITAKDMYETLTRKNTKLNLGYPLLDSSLKLMQNDFLIIGAGTGQGKTAFAINLLNRVSKDYKCIYFNMEMSPAILYKRMIGSMTNITLKELENINELSLEDKNKVKKAMETYQEREITLVNKVTSIKEMQKIVERAKTDKHIVVFVDHLGLVKSTGNSLYEKTTNVAKGLRTLFLSPFYWRAGSYRGRFLPPPHPSNRTHAGWKAP